MNGLAADAGLRVGQTLSLPAGIWSDRLNIRVTNPLAGAAVSSPLVIEGSASVFENIVNVEVLDASGGTLARASDRAASPDIGQHGSFRIAVTIPDSARGRPATVQVFWNSPRDGSPSDVVRIPVTVAPG